MTIAILTPGRSIGSMVGRGDRPPTQNPCWSNSYDVNDERCANFPHDIEADEIGPMLTVVAQFARQTKAAGKRCGELLTHGVEMLRYLYNESGRNAGICCPSQAQIAAALNIAPSTVGATLNALRRVGLLEWLRRTQASDQPGPDRVQTSSLYRFLMPKALAWRVSKFMLRRYGRTARIPRSLAATLTPEQVEARANQFDAERLLRRLRREVRARSPRPAPDTVDRHV